jgi:L-glyceraldehyde 3-phosphate reductase
MGALDSAVRSGKALYAGISNYDAGQTARALAVLRQLGTPCLIHQMKYSMFVRTPEEGLLDRLSEEGVGGIAFSPLAQGLLTDRYLEGVPSGSRASKPGTFLKRSDVTEDRVARVRALGQVARERGQSLAQLALAWTLRPEAMASALIGASRVEQIEQCVATQNNLRFDAAELRRIESILA